MAQTTYGATNHNSDATVASDRLSQSSDQHDSASNSPTNQTEQARRKAEELKDSAVSKASEKHGELKEQAIEATEAAKQQAYEAARRARESGRRYADEKKAGLASEIGVFSSAIRKAGGKLHEEQHDSIASYVDAAAEQLDRVRDSLESKDVSEIVGDLQDFTRRRPEIVYGGLFVAGLAAMRFLKASKQTPHQPNGVDRDLSRDINRSPAAFGHTPQRTVTPPPVAQTGDPSIHRSNRS